MTPSPPLRCLVVDDEPLLRRHVRRLVESHPALALVGEARDGFEAQAALSRPPDGGGPVDAVFLDVEMPHLDGLAFVRTLVRPPLVVVVTAYPEHAVVGFDLGVVDYLLKPVSPERFARAAGRLLGAQASTPAPPAAAGPLYVHADGAAVRVDVERLVAVEATGNYVRLHDASGRPGPVVRTGIEAFLERLQPGRFVRVHRSWAVSVTHVERVEAHRVRIGGLAVPVSRRSRANLLRALRLA